MMASLRELGQEGGGHEGHALAGNPLDVNRDARGLLHFGTGDTLTSAV